MKHQLDDLVREARQELGKREVRQIDWSSVDRGLFAAIERERSSERPRVLAESWRLWTVASVGLAVAAAVGAVVVSGRGDRTPATEDRTVAVESAGTVTGLTGAGQALVNGRPAAVGTTLHLGDAIESRGASFTVQRPGKLTFVLEPGSLATVTHVRGALVLELDRGAVEAQVVPVSSGEAFAVDVGTSRVAVHGTHLRVARAGALGSSARVVVDLNEGVVAVGEAPRMGDVLGALVTAPAHAEFGPGESLGTLTVTHDPGAVRPPVPLDAATLAKTTRVTPPAPSSVIGAAGPTGATAEASSRSSSSGPSHADPRPPASLAATTAAVTPASDSVAREAIGAAVRACVGNIPHAENVTVVVNTALYLDVGDDGVVRAARFDPPVLPDVNACAVKTIYKTRFSHGGSLSIPIDVGN